MAGGRGALDCSKSEFSISSYSGEVMATAGLSVAGLVAFGTVTSLAAKIGMPRLVSDAPAAILRSSVRVWDRHH